MQWIKSGDYVVLFTTDKWGRPVPTNKVVPASVPFFLRWLW